MEKTIRCPYCGEEILAIAKKCKHCAEWLDSSVKPSLTYPSLTPATVNEALSIKYKIVSKIGKGGMSVVYKAVQKNLDRVVALKILPPQMANDEEYVERFHLEARAAAQLSHPNIITIFDEGIENRIHYMAMEYLEGIDLYNKIKQNGILSPDELIKIILPITSALNYAHKRGLVHRDVKSGNIFLTIDGRSILMDFGIAHIIKGAQLTISGSVLGTPEYMSPEQADGKEIDGRSDIYSTGVVMYQALTGRLPFSPDNPMTMIYKLLNEPHIPINKIINLPNWLEAAVEGCLEKDPANRIQSCSQLADILKNKKLYKRIVTAPTFETVKLKKEEINEEFIQTKKEVEKEKVKIPDAAEIANRKIKQIIILKDSSVLRRIIILSIFALAFAAGIIYLMSMNKNESYSKIINNFQNDKLKPAENIPVQSEKSENQNPNLKLKKDVITLNKSTEVKTIKEEEQTVAVPPVTDLSPKAAGIILKNSGLKIGAISKIISGNKNKGVVFIQVPASGSKLKKGSKVNLIVGE